MFQHLEERKKKHTPNIPYWRIVNYVLNSIRILSSYLRIIVPNICISGSGIMKKIIFSFEWKEALELSESELMSFLTDRRVASKLSFHPYNVEWLFTGTCLVQKITLKIHVEIRSTVRFNRTCVYELRKFITNFEMDELFSDPHISLKDFFRKKNNIVVIIWPHSRLLEIDEAKRWFFFVVYDIIWGFAGNINNNKIFNWKRNINCFSVIGIVNK